MLPTDVAATRMQLPLGLGRWVGAAPDEQQDAPRLGVTGDRARDLATRLVRCRQVFARVRVLHARRVGQRGTQDAVGGRELDQRLTGPAGDGDRGEPGLLGPPRRDLTGAERVADRLHRGVERRVRALECLADGRPADRRQLADQVEHRLVVLERHDRAAAAAGGGPVIERLDRRERDGGVARGEEALEVAHAVAPVTARVDPVVAQASGVAPGSDRVGVYAQHLRGSRDRERRVERSRMEQINLGQ